MIVAYNFGGHDGDAFFFEDRKASIFCPICGTLLDRDFLPEGVRPRKKWDVCSSYENRTIVTERFKKWCESRKFDGLVFRQVCETPPYYVLEPSNVLRFDPRRARFENKCAACGNYESIVLAGPFALLNVQAPIEEGFFRTDLEFGSRWEKSPLIVVGVRTMDAIKQERFRLVEFEPIEAPDESR
jgi:hypothetical protein